MRPIKLTVKGLHSFREKQSINFEALCDGGVFGIFGPTGSGKSSLLDAMTLALYGKVERATNNTQGILNHAEDELYVSFTFQLGHAERGKRYEVERSFKRSGDVNLRAVTCRFIEKSTPPVVIADKMGEVNKAVEGLLGLSIDDFTRAVVLPQGKFSEFLSLKGSERRQMLQRLFHLEKYGDQLNIKLKQRLTNTKHDKELVEKEQLGLGNASQEVLQVTKSKLVQINQQLDDEKSKLVEIEKRAEEEKNIVTLQQEKLAAEKSINDLAMKEKEISLLNTKLKRAREAKILLPYASDLKESLREKENRKAQVTAASKELTELETLLKDAEIQYQQRKQEKEKNETVVRLKLDHLARLKKDQEVVLKESVEVGKLENDVSIVKSKVKEYESLKENAQNELKRFQEKKNELQQELTKIHITSEVKREIFRSFEEKQNIEGMSKQLEELSQEMVLLKEKQTHVQKDASETEEEVKRLEAHLLDRFRQIYQWYERVSEEEREMLALTRLLNNRKEDLEKNNHKVLIVQLRKELWENEACPVCGSMHHPNKSDEETNEGNLEVEELKLINELVADVETKQRTVERFKWLLDSNASTLNEFVNQEKLQEISLPVNNTEVYPDNETSFYYENIWQEKLAKMEKEQETIEQLLERVNTEVKGYKVLKNVWAEKVADVNNITERVNDAFAKHKDIEVRFTDQKQQWEKAFPAYHYETINETYKDIQLQEEKAEKLRGRIEKSTPHIEAKQKEIEGLANDIQEAKIRESSLITELSQRKKAMQEKLLQIKETIGEANIDELISDVQRQLKELIENYHKAEKAYNERKEGRRELENQLSTYKEANRQGEEWHGRASSNWQEQIAKTSISTMEDVNLSVLEDEEMVKIEDSIEQFRKKKQDAQLKLEDTVKRLAGRMITEEELEKTNALLEEIKAKIEKLGSDKGGVETTLQDVQQKVKRFEQLETERKDLEQAYNQLLKLDQVFRGKAFVEYIAEEQLIQVSRLASERLHSLTRGRYALEVDSNGGFIIRDDANGGIRRPVTTLSGGETFLTSLALALSLSASIQLRGEYPLEFFFLDEGFGTLDQELLETVICSLEQLHTDQLAVGVISHVPELKERLPRKIIVTPAEAGGRGSRISMESM